MRGQQIQDRDELPVDFVAGGGGYRLTCVNKLRIAMSSNESEDSQMLDIWAKNENLNVP